MRLTVSTGECTLHQKLLEAKATRCDLFSAALCLHCTVLMRFSGPAQGFRVVVMSVSCDELIWPM